MAVPVHEIHIGQFDDANEDIPRLSHSELNTLDKAPDFDPREGQAFIDDEQLAFGWDEGDEDDDEELSDDEFGYDEVNHADWEVADGGS